jgi:hypothetical protein
VNNKIGYENKYLKILISQFNIRNKRISRIEEYRESMTRYYKRNINIYKFIEKIL